jgi:hypothetical protein
MSKSKVNKMIICFFGRKGTVHSMFVPLGQTVNQKFHLQFWNVSGSGSSCETRIVPRQADRASRQRALTNGAFRQGVFGEKIHRGLDHPAYSPNLNSCDFFLFPIMNNHLKGSHFETVEKIQVTKAVVNNLQENDLRKYFDSCKAGIHAWLQKATALKKATTV